MATSRYYQLENDSLATPDVLQAVIKETAREYTRSVTQKHQRAGVLIEAASEHRRNIKAVEKKKRKALYAAMRDGYELLCLALTSNQIRVEIRKAAKEANIPETKGTPMALLIAKLCIGAEEATASQQAQALNGALVKKIDPDEFPAHLESDGIARLATHFRRQRAGGNGPNRSGGSRPASPSAQREFDFSARALRKLQKAEDEGAPDITMAAYRTDDGVWYVDTVKIGTPKE
jgi:hypothetical protein